MKRLKLYCLDEGEKKVNYEYSGQAKLKRGITRISSRLWEQNNVHLSTGCCDARERQGNTEVPSGMLILEAMNLRVKMAFL